jgi:DNA-directed RNA polymerase specialized sigma24 family protein
MPLSAEEQAKAVLSLQADASPDNPSFGLIVDEYGRRLRGFIRMRARCDADVDEILSELWLKFWRSLSRFDLNRLQRERSGLAPFLYTVALSAMIDYYRKWNRERGLVGSLCDELRQSSSESASGEDSGAGLDRAADPGPSPEEICAEWERRESVLRIAFGQTGRPPHEVLVFGLTVCLGWKPQELVRDRLAESTLQSVELQLEQGIRGTAFLPESVIDSLFGPLRKSLQLSSEHVRDHLGTRIAPVIGQTALSDYYMHPADPCEQIRIWRYNVVRRTVLLARIPNSN